MKRRDALKTIGGIAGTASLARFLPGCGGSDEPGGITTIVYVMMENRSYDHQLGARALEGLGGDGLQPGMSNPDLDGNPIAPYVAERDQHCIQHDPPHGWDTTRAQFNAGACDGFVTVHQIAHDDDRTLTEPMQYLTRNEVPVSWALADAYTSCDRWFASNMAPTWPNRFYWLTGTSMGTMDNPLPDVITWPTVFHRLTEAGVSWKSYFATIPTVSLIDGLDHEAHVFGFADFLADAEAGTLPAVSYIDPAFNDSDDHPPAHPINGQQFIAAVYTALADSPQWKNCLLLVVYDEHGGFFDHVPPPTAVDDLAAQGFDQLGFRVPALVVGPYVKAGHVSSVVYDHTSALKFLENQFGLPPFTARVTAAADLTDCIDAERLASGDWAPPAEIPIVDIDSFPHVGQCYGPLPERTAPPSHGHPVLEWADANPERIRGFDARDDLPALRRRIRDRVLRRPRAWTK
jgi:phospholipase C